jgi:hypothetical protein
MSRFGRISAELLALLGAAFTVGYLVGWSVHVISLLMVRGS